MTQTIGQSLLAEFEHEMAPTRKVLERVPLDKADWKPHPKSFELWKLAQLVSWMPGWIEQALSNPYLDLKGTGGYKREATPNLLKEFDENVRKSKDALAKVKDEEFAKSWSLKMGDQEVWKAPKHDVVRNHMNHLIHHRAQLGVYLRLLDVPVPAMYGPSADEKTFSF